MRICKLSGCDTETENPYFCSRTCAAKYNNSKNPKRKINLENYTCSQCGGEAKYRRKYCPSCLEKYEDSRSYGDDPYLSEVIYRRKDNKSSAYSLVRLRARKILTDDNRHCEKCGYDKHVEVCHIEPIHKFTSDTRLSVINHPDNLRILCKNCHWEMDNGYF